MGGLVDPSWYTHEGQERGHVVHMAAEGIFTGQPVSVAAEYRGYVSALEAAFETLKFIAIWVEKRLCLKDVTGRPDAIGWLTARTGKLWPGPVIIDVKSGDKDVSHGVQLSFYEMLADACGAREALPSEFRELPWQRVGLYVNARGGYRLHPHTDPNDRLIAHAILDLTRWRVAHGLITPDRNDDDPELAEEVAHGIIADTVHGSGSEQPAGSGIPREGA